MTAGLRRRILRPTTSIPNARRPSTGSSPVAGDRRRSPRRSSISRLRRFPVAWGAASRPRPLASAPAATSPTSRRPALPRERPRPRESQAPRDAPGEHTTRTRVVDAFEMAASERAGGPGMTFRHNRASQCARRTSRPGASSRQRTHRTPRTTRWRNRSKRPAGAESPVVASGHAPKLARRSRLDRVSTASSNTQVSATSHRSGGSRASVSPHAKPLSQRSGSSWKVAADIWLIKASNGPTHRSGGGRRIDSGQPAPSKWRPTGSRANKRIRASPAGRHRGKCGEMSTHNMGWQASWGRQIRLCGQL